MSETGEIDRQPQHRVKKKVLIKRRCFGEKKEKKRPLCLSQDIEQRPRRTVEPKGGATGPAVGGRRRRGAGTDKKRERNVKTQSSERRGRDPSPEPELPILERVSGLGTNIRVELGNVGQRPSKGLATTAQSPLTGFCFKRSNKQPVRTQIRPEEQAIWLHRASQPLASACSNDCPAR
ncbi:hypothetical protein VTI28DRAFT_3553 [Corynascus sepedonium]